MVLTWTRHAMAITVCVASVASAQRRGFVGPGESDGPRPRLFGFALECESCAPAQSGGGFGRGPLAVWHYTKYPRVFAVAAGGPAERAGIKVNDLVVAIDGVSLLTADGARRMTN